VAIHTNAVEFHIVSNQMWKHSDAENGDITLPGWVLKEEICVLRYTEAKKVQTISAQD